MENLFPGKTEGDRGRKTLLRGDDKPLKETRTEYRVTAACSTNSSWS